MAELTELKVIVQPFMPRDELWVHPSMFAMLKRMCFEADEARRSGWRYLDKDTATTGGGDG